jgi:hypothetical protein
VSSAGLRPKSDCSGKAQKQLYSCYRPVLSSEIALQNNKIVNIKKKISRGKKNWSWVPDGRLTPRQTGRLTVGRNLTSTSASLAIDMLIFAVSCVGCCTAEFGSSVEINEVPYFTILLDVTSDKIPTILTKHAEIGFYEKFLV